MKKIIYIFFAAGILAIVSCNGATNKKSGNSADSGATGSSGAAASAGNGSAAGNSNVNTDTSTTGKSVTNPTVDSSKTKP